MALAELADGPATWPGLGRRDPGPLRLVLVEDAAALRRFSRGLAPGWGAAVALPGARTIALRADAPDLPGTLRHELAHLALHDAVRVRLPLWFDEGYAAWAAGEFGGLDALRLNLAVTGGGVPELDRLNAELRGPGPGVGAAYALAMSAVMELARRHPTGSLDPLLERLQGGESFADAVRASTGLTVEQFDLAWRRALRRRYSLLTWLLGGGGWLLVAAGLWLAVRYRRRADRSRRAALDAGWDIPPDDLLPDPPRPPDPEPEPLDRWRHPR